MQVPGNFVQLLAGMDPDYLWCLTG